MDLCRVSYRILFKSFDDGNIDYMRRERWGFTGFFDVTNEHDDGSCYSSCSGSDHGDRCEEDGRRWRNEAVVYNLEENLKDFEDEFQRINEIKKGKDFKRLKFEYDRV